MGSSVLNNVFKVRIVLFYFCINFLSNSYCEMDNLRFYFVTWNVATKLPEQDLHSLLDLAPNPREDKVIYDFYIIGLQEVKAQPQNLLLDVLFDDPWTNAFRTILEKRNFVKVKTIRLQGILLSVYCLRRHLLHLRDIETQYTRTGFNGLWGNKGAVSIRLSIYGCSICFVNAHLTPHDHLLAERIEDYNSIIRGQEFHVKETSNILFHDYVFWVGDLNFRLSGEATTSAMQIQREINQGHLEALLAKDQLRLVMETGDAFSELTETPPTFPPTYKFEMGTREYDLKRRPAWCDRVLYRVTPNNYENVTLQIDQRSYASHEDYVQSDHRPVTSEFNIKVPSVQSSNRYRRAVHQTDDGLQVFSDYTERVVEFSAIPIWFLDEVNTATYKLSSDVRTTPGDWVAIFKDGFSSLDDYLSYVYVSKGSSPILGSQSPGKASGSTSRQTPPRSYTINFPETAIRSSGMYRLVYFSQSPDSVVSVLGMSEPFSIQPREHDIHPSIAF